MKIIIVSATSFEIAPFIRDYSKNLFYKRDINIFEKITGIGQLTACQSILKILLLDRPDIIVQTGIAGSFDKKFEIGDTVVVSNECLGDLGVQENGNWNDMFDMGFVGANQHPYKKSLLPNPYLSKYNLLKLRECSSLTVNTITTGKERIEQLKIKYRPQIESMEGAALHYCCLLEDVPFIQFRSISNMVGERDKNYWNIPLAIKNLNQTLFDWFDMLALQQ